MIVPDAPIDAGLTQAANVNGHAVIAAVSVSRYSDDAAVNRRDI
jgi:hypothetical protein